MASGMWLLVFAGLIMFGVGVIGWTKAADKRAAAAVDVVLPPERDWEVEDLLDDDWLTDDDLLTTDLYGLEYGLHSTGIQRFVVDYLPRHLLAREVNA